MDTLLKLSVYDDRGAQQGRAVAHLTGQGEEGQRCEGHVWLSRLVAIEDPYFDWWHDKTYAGGAVPLHACARQAQRCTQGTLFRNVLHMDVFRILPGRSAMGLKWLSDDENARIEGIINSRPTGTDPAGRSAGGGPLRRGLELPQGPLELRGLRRPLVIGVLRMRWPGKRKRMPNEEDWKKHSLRTQRNRLSPRTWGLSYKTGRQQRQSCLHSR